MTWPYLIFQVIKTAFVKGDLDRKRVMLKENLQRGHYRWLMGMWSWCWNILKSLYTEVASSVLSPTESEDFIKKYPIRPPERKMRNKLRPFSFFSTTVYLRDVSFVFKTGTHVYRAKRDAYDWCIKFTRVQFPWYFGLTFILVRHLYLLTNTSASFVTYVLLGIPV